MPESNIDNYRIEQYSMRFVGYTASSVANPNPVEGESRTLCSGTAQVTLCSGTAQVVNVCNFHLSKITWNCVSASLKKIKNSSVKEAANLLINKFMEAYQQSPEMYEKIEEQPAYDEHIAGETYPAGIENDFSENQTFTEAAY